MAHGTGGPVSEVGSGDWKYWIEVLEGKDSKLRKKGVRSILMK